MDGKGSATITDMTVDLVDNPEKYEDIYPSDSEKEELGEEDGDESDQTEDPPEVKALAKELADVDDALKRATEGKASATSQISMLNDYAISLGQDRPADLGSCVQAYREERRKASDLLFACEKEISELSKKRLDLSKKHDKATKTMRKQKQNEQAAGRRCDGWRTSELP